MKITICGGGSLGHVCAGVLSSHEDVEVCLLTNRPAQWSRRIEVADMAQKIYVADIAKASNQPAEVIPDADMVFICQPGFLIESTLQQIKPWLKKGAVVGSIVASTGFFFQAHKILSDGVGLFGFQRTPFIARVEEYGHSARLLGYKSEVAIAVEGVADVEQFRREVERLFITPTILRNNHYEVSLTNSNPILHTGRLYSMWHDWNGKVYDHNILFYKEWTDEASQLLIDMDAEFMTLLERLPVTKGAIPSLLEYYESTDAPSLTRKIASIAAFQTITSPMKQVEDGWVPDFASRYFTEDFPFGLKYIKDTAVECGVKTPIIDKVLAWGLSKIEKN